MQYQHNMFEKKGLFSLYTRKETQKRALSARVLQCIAVYFSVLQCVVVCCSTHVQMDLEKSPICQQVVIGDSLSLDNGRMQCVAVCDSVLQRVAVCCSTEIEKSPICQQVVIGTELV